MPRAQAAGLVLYRRGNLGWEVLLVHPSGSYNRAKPWSIPKGLIDDGEDAQTAARRETWEEAGVTMTGAIVPLGSVDYTKSKKRVFGFAGEAPADAAPRCASWEVDRAEFVQLSDARKMLHPDQVPFLDRLVELLVSS
jgi:predicted NUDIX family NTP pyrophosphohydrolase